MMVKYKKLAVAILALSSSAAFSGTMGPVCSPENITIPCAQSAWDFGVQALYLKTSYSDVLSWTGANQTGAFTLGAPTTVNFVENNSRWNWGFKLEAGYHFNTGNDVNLNWYHLGHKTNTSTFNRSQDAFTIFDDTTHTISIKPEWDAVNLELGQRIDLASIKNIRVHGGVQYARIKTISSGTGTGIVAGTTLFPTATDTTFNNISYNGFGPRIGADLSYGFSMQGLSIYSNLATALLTGTSKFSQQYSDSLGTTVGISGSKNMVVPELEGKLGLKYAFNMAQGDLSVDLGYLWINYFNAQTIETAESNFSIQGPYLGLKWLGNL